MAGRGTNTPKQPQQSARKRKASSSLPSSHARDKLSKTNLGPKQTTSNSGERSGNKDSEGSSDFARNLLVACARGVQSSRKLPAGSDLRFARTDRQYRAHAERVTQRVLDIAQRLVVGTETSTARRQNTPLMANAHPPLNDFARLALDEHDERFDLVVRKVDSLLEQVDAFFDERAGFVAAEDPSAKRTAEAASAKHKQARARNVLRPQSRFPDTVDNSNTPFTPRLHTKPHALVPLEQSLKRLGQVAAESPSSSTTATQDSERDGTPAHIKAHLQTLGVGETAAELGDYADEFVHPYEYEIDHFAYAAEQLTKTDERMYAPLDETPVVMIDKKPQLVDLVAKLSSEHEIAVDLEQHAHRSYQGFVCLMQISTRQSDYLVDTLALRGDMWQLNEVFANPRIVKVFHGADHDIVWLQRDFGLYVVNLFDTGQAMRTLDFPRPSLANLLLRFCGVTADKSLQRADWRVRPLSDELIAYARQDTHYLLYMYDRLRNELIKSGDKSNSLLLDTLLRCRELSKKCYRRPRLSVDSHMKALERMKGQLTAVQLEVFRDLFHWRDKLAREEDESPTYILPKGQMMRMAEQMPTDVVSLLACCTHVPPFVRVSAHELVALITRARQRVLKPGSVPSPVPHSSGKDGATQSGKKNRPTSSPAALQSQLRRDRSVDVNTHEPLFQQLGWLDSAPVANESRSSSGARVSKTNKTRGASVPLEGGLFGASRSRKLGENDSEPATQGSCVLLSPQLVQERIKEIHRSFDDSIYRLAPHTMSLADATSDSSVLGAAAGNVGTNLVDASDRPTGSTHSASAREENLPRSLRQIYQLSNEARQQKRVRGSQQSASRNSKSSGTETDRAIDATTAMNELLTVRANGSASDTPVAFLKDIGWIGENDELPVRGGESNVSSGESGSSGGAGGGSDRGGSGRGSDRGGSGRGSGRGRKGGAKRKSNDNSREVQRYQYDYGATSGSFAVDGESTQSGGGGGKKGGGKRNSRDGGGGGGGGFNGTVRAPRGGGRSRTSGGSARFGKQSGTFSAN